MRRTISAQNDICGTSSSSLRRMAVVTLSSAAVLVGCGLCSVVPLDFAHAQITCQLDDNSNGGAVANGSQAFACGPGSDADGANSTAVGHAADVEAPAANETVQHGTAIGNRTDVYDDGGTALGRDAEAGTDNADADAEENATAIGHRTTASSEGSTVLGAYGRASGDFATAIGGGEGRNADVTTRTEAEGDYSTAIGFGAKTEPGAHGAVAFGSDSSGNGAQATMENQFVLGTQNHTYTAPGITSTTSKNRQSGPLEVLTSDANGNLATDGGALFDQVERNREDIKENTEGVALAMAVENPDLKGAETFGIMLNWGSFEGESAIGLTGMGVLYEDVDGGRLSLGGGVGWGVSEGTVGGRVGLQWTQ